MLQGPGVEAVARSMAHRLRVIANARVAALYRCDAAGGSVKWTVAAPGWVGDLPAQVPVTGPRWFRAADGHYLAASLGGAEVVAVLGPFDRPALGQVHEALELALAAGGRALAAASADQEQDLRLALTAVEFSAAALLGDISGFRRLLFEIRRDDFVGDGRSVLDDVIGRFDRFVAGCGDDSEMRLRLAGLSALARARDAEAVATRGHHERVTRCSFVLARSLGCEPTVAASVGLAAQFHDIGQGPLGARILADQSIRLGLFTGHTLIGEAMLRALGLPPEVTDAVRGHHERWDGGGYPDGSVGEATPRAARVLAVCEAFDELIMDRPWRRGLDPAAAAASVEAGCGSQFDPVVADALLVVWPGTQQVAEQAG